MGIHFNIHFKIQPAPSIPQLLPLLLVQAQPILDNPEKNTSGIALLDYERMVLGAPSRTEAQCSSTVVGLGSFQRQIVYLMAWKHGHLRHCSLPSRGMNIHLADIWWSDFGDFGNECRQYNMCISVHRYYIISYFSHMIYCKKVYSKIWQSIVTYSIPYYIITY